MPAFQEIVSKARVDLSTVVTASSSLLVLLAADAVDVFAQPVEPIQLPPIVVTSSRLPSGTSIFPTGTTVISREQIEARAPTSAVDLLRQVPGLHIDQPGGRGGVSSVYLRGADPNFMLVMIDGVRVNDPTNSRGGSFNFNTLDPGSIERIEIIRGPLSSVYGSDAIAGAINIITRGGGALPQVAVQGEGGESGYRRGWAEASGPIGKGSFAFSAAAVDDGEPVEGSTFTSNAFNGNITLVPDERTTVRLTGRFAESDATSFPDDSGGPLFAVLRDVDERDSRELTLGGELTREIGPRATVIARASHYSRDEDFASPGVAPGVRDPFGIVPNTSDDRFRRETATAYTVLSPSPGVELSLGGEGIFEHGTSDSALIIGGVAMPGRFELSREVYAPFGEVRITFPMGLTLEGGVRADYPDAFDREISPRVGVRQVFDSKGTALWASWGEGFKLPSFFALAHPIVGNPDLVPETSESAEAGIEQKLPEHGVTLRTTLFHNRYFNLIDFEEGPPPRLVNRSQVTAKGVEFGFDAAPTPLLTLGADVTYTETDIAETTEELRNRPKWRAGGNVLWQARPDLTVALSGTYVGMVFDSSIPTGDLNLDPYFRADLSVTWQARPNVELTFAVDNLFDADYEEAVGFPGPGIRPRFAARARF